MTNRKTKYSISEAARIAGKSRTTIQTHVKEGRLSVEEGTGGKKLVDASELIRVYGDECDFERAGPGRGSSEKPGAQRPATGQESATGELASVQQLLENERRERQREREQLQSRIDFLEEAVKQAQEGFNRTTLLLESRTGGVGDLEKSLRSLEARLANQEKKASEEREAIKNKARLYKRAYEAEKQKTAWEKLFGRSGEQRAASRGTAAQQS